MIIDTGTHSPIKQRPYRTPPNLKKFEEEQIEEMLKNGVIRPSASPWSSPVVLAPKKGNTWRFCVNVKKLNEITKTDAYPLLLINNFLD